MQPLNKKQLDGDTPLLLPVLVNAPNFENYKSAVSNDDKLEHNSSLEFKRSVLANIVRALYHAASREGIIDAIDINEIIDSNKQNVKVGFLGLGTDQKNQTPLPKDKTILRNKISFLFRRAIATEVKTQSNLKELALDKYLKETETKSSINWLSVAKVLIVSFPLALGVAFLLPNEGILTKIVPLLISSLPAAVTMYWQRRKISTNSNRG